MKDREEVKKRRVVITGIGVVAPNGIGKEEFCESLKEGKNAIDNISSFNARNYPSRVAGEIRNFRANDYIPKKEIHKIGRSAHLGIAASLLAIKDSGLILTEKEKRSCPVFMGSSVGGMDFAELEFKKFFDKGIHHVSPYAGVAVFCASVSSEISKVLSLKGRSITISTGCVSASDAIGNAFNYIRSGLSDIAICGGADACVTPGILATFCQMKVTSTHYNDSPKIASRPFDRDRDGFVIGEGAWIFVLEEFEKAKSRNANIYAEICGYEATCDAYHQTSPHPQGIYSTRAIRCAIKDAGLKPEEINFILAYGNSTPVNDPHETMIIKKVFGQNAYKIPVSSIKSMIGHPIGASGAAQVAASALAIKEGFIPPTINHNNPDQKCDLDYVPNKSRLTKIKTALCNTLSFGGKNAAIVLKEVDNAS